MNKNTVRPWYFQPRPNVPWTFLLVGVDMHEIIKNQSRKTSFIRLPKFTTVNIARKCHQGASFSIKKVFFEDYFFGSLMKDVFLD